MRPKDQGTAWETELVNKAHDRGFAADRLPEGGGKDRGDVWIINPPATDYSIVALAWKRLTGKGQRRTPDGERDVVVLTLPDFLDLVYHASIADHDIGFIIEAKARQTLNVTRELHKARLKARNLA